MWSASWTCVDQDALGGVVPLIVNVDGAAVTDDAGVIDDGAEFRRDGLTDPVRVGAGPLAVEVGLEAMADRLMQKDA